MKWGGVAKLRDLRPGELALYRALAHVDGPWWGEREDVLAAAVCQSLAATVGHEAGVEDCRVRWGGDEPAELMSFADGVAILSGVHVGG